MVSKLLIEFVLISEGEAIKCSHWNLYGIKQ